MDLIKKDTEIINELNVNSEEDFEVNRVIKYLTNDLNYNFLKNCHNKEKLVENLRHHLERLNNDSHRFNEDDWTEILKNIRNMNSQYDRVLSFKEGYLQSNIKFKDYNGNEQRLKVVDFKNIENNILDVARQVRSENNDKVFDVLILLNGFPFCLMELKYEKDLWSAYYQIDHEYKNEINNDAFFRFISVFACVRPEEARYYSNIEQNEKNSAGVRSDFNFTNLWLDEKNKDKIKFIDFAKAFLNKNEVLNILKRYLMFDWDANKIKHSLLIMRPYQIHAMNKVLGLVNQALSENFSKKTYRGYVWHSTGSGKTITSYKIAETIVNEADKFNDIEKIIFVVDRTELLNQTYDRFCTFSNSTRKKPKIKNLYTYIPSNQREFIVTTIQSLNKFCKSDYFKKNKDKIDSKKIVFIFDECHRTQNGQMHERIRDSFKNKVFVGFTGTPYFGPSRNNELLTTKELFGDELHRYTSFEALRDHKILPSLPIYKKTYKNVAISSSQRHTYKWIEINANTILKKFYTLTKKDGNYTNEEDFHKAGYNAMLVAPSVDSAIRYYQELMKIISKDSKYNFLKIACAYSVRKPKENVKNSEYQFYRTKDAEHQIEKKSQISLSDREFDKVTVDMIKNFNSYYFPNYDGVSIEHDKYIKDVSNAFKNKKIDLLIVCNMFTTGFDVPKCNTIFIDRKYEEEMHLFQTISRINRIATAKECGFVFFFDHQEDFFIRTFLKYSDCSLKELESVYKSFNDWYSIGFENECGNYYQESYSEIVNKVFKFLKNGEFEWKEWDKEDIKNFFNYSNNLLKIRRHLKVYDEYDEKKDPLNNEWIKKIIGARLGIQSENKKKRITKNYSDASLDSFIYHNTDEFSDSEVEKKRNLMDYSWLKKYKSKIEKQLAKKTNYTRDDYDKECETIINERVKPEALNKLNEIFNSFEIKDIYKKDFYSYVIFVLDGNELTDNEYINNRHMDKMFENNEQPSARDKKRELCSKILAWKDEYETVPDIISFIKLQKISSSLI